MRTCHIIGTHRWNDTRVFWRECCTLAKAGLETHLVSPSGTSGNIHGVNVHSLGYAKPPRLCHLLTRDYVKILRIGYSLRADVYHIHEPHLIPIAWVLRKRGKIILDIHEHNAQIGYYPDRATRLWGRIYSRLERWGGKIASGIVCATPSIKLYFEQILETPTVLVQNFPSLSDPIMQVGGIRYTERPQEIIYVGGITRDRGAFEMAQAIEKVNDPARLVIVGDFSPSCLKDSLSKLPCWTRIHYCGWLSREEVAKLLGTARIGLVLLHPTPNYMESQPIKLFEYMAAGIPVIASDFPLWREIVDSAQCGLLVDPLDPKAIAEAIEWLLTHPEEAEAMGQRGRKAVEERYNWECEARKLLALYETLREVEVFSS